MIAILLCGGKGERLRPLTLEIPKPMVKIKGKPIISYILNQIKHPKISNFQKAFLISLVFQKIVSNCLGIIFFQGFF